MERTNGAPSAQARISSKPAFRRWWTAWNIVWGSDRGTGRLESLLLKNIADALHAFLQGLGGICADAPEDFLAHVAHGCRNGFERLSRKCVEHFGGQFSGSDSFRALAQVAQVNLRNRECGCILFPQSG